jgi:L-fuconolactonase
MIIDAHHHLWDPRARRHAWLDGFPALDQRFDLADFRRVSAPVGVTASVLVQVLPSVAETAEFLALADTAASGIAGVVGWADLTSQRIADNLAGLRALPGGGRLVGIRHLAQDEPDPDWLLRPDVRRGLRAVAAAGLAYDLLIRPTQLSAALRVTAALDDARFVLDHGGKPEIAAGRLQPWAGLIKELAQRPNVACKVSGLVTEAGADWTPAKLAPYTDQLLDCFGPDRLMFGSDWPVCTLAASYADVIRTAGQLMSSRLSSTELDAFLARNAIAAYQLRPADK